MKRHGHVTHGDHGLDFQRRQGTCHLIQPRPVAFKCCQGLIGAGEDRFGAFKNVAQAVDVQGNDLHGLADGNDRDAGLNCHAFGGAVPGAGLLSLDPVVGDQLHAGPEDVAGVLIANDRPIHLGEFAQPRRGKIDSDVKTAGTDCIHRAVKTKHNQCASAAPQNTLEPIPELCAGCNARQSRLK